MNRQKNHAGKSDVIFQSFYRYAQLIVFRFDDRGHPGRNRAGYDLLRQRVLHMPLDVAPQRPCAVCLLVGMIQNIFLYRTGISSLKKIT